MSTIRELTNLGSCGVGAVLGTNSKKGCIKQLTSARALWAFAPGSSFLVDGTFDLTAVQLLQAQGKLIVFQGVNTFEENGDEDAIETLDDTTKIVTTEGKYAFLATFTNGLDFNTALHTIKGFGNWNFAIVTSKGDILGAKDTALGLTGFDTGMIQPAKLQVGTTQSGQKEGLMFQFLDRDEFDSGFLFIEKANLSFNPLKVEGINEAVITYVNTPSNTDTIITIKVTLKDMKTVVSGLPFGAFLRLSDGVAEQPTAGDDSVTAGTYVLTVAAIATGEVETTEIYDNSNNRDVYLLSPDLYQSATATATATA